MRAWRFLTRPRSVTLVLGRLRPAVWLLCLSACVLPGSAANWFVSVGARGAGTGANWTDAWPDFPQIQWASVQPGDTVFIGGGTYTNRLTIGASGTANNPVSVMRVKATDVAATSAAGWNPSFDSTVVVAISNSFGIVWNQGPGVGSYVTVDGRQDGGLQCLMPDVDNGAGVVLYTGSTGVVLNNIEVAGPGSPNTGGYPFQGDVRGMQLYGPAYSSNLLISHCRIHGVVDAFYLIGNTDTTIDHCLIYDIWACQTTNGNLCQQHDNVCITYNTTNITFSNNQIWNWATEGIGLFGPATNWWIYGNVWHDDGTNSNGETGRVLESQVTTNGPIYFYNNTVANVWMGIRSDGASHYTLDSRGCNNLYWNVLIPESGFPTNDYDFSNWSLALYNEPHGVGNGAYPFVAPLGAYPFVSTNNFHILATVGPNYPSHKGVSLPSPYNIDLDGNVRGADGAWDIGAYQTPFGLAPAPPAGLRVTPLIPGFLAPGYYAWWNADTLSAANGTYISAWQSDGSGTAGTLIANQTGALCYLTNNAVNGHSAVVLNGAAYYSSYACASPSDLPQPYSVFIVAQQAASSVGNNCAMFGGINSYNGEVRVGGDGTYLFYNGSSVSGGNSSIATNWTLYSLVLSNSAASTLFTNGVACISGANGPGDLQGLVMGAANTSGFPWAGPYATCLIYTNGLTPAQRSSTEQFLMTMYGIPH